MEKQTYLTFVVGDEYFAVNVKHVLEVLQQQQITPVPQTPAHILGIINFRGDILPVTDLRYKFNLVQDDVELRRITIVFDISTDNHHLIMAATADAVKDVISVDDDEVKPVPELGISYNTKFIDGVIRRDNRFVLMLNMERIFSFSDITSVETVPCD